MGNNGTTINIDKITADKIEVLAKISTRSKQSQLDHMTNDEIQTIEVNKKMIKIYKLTEEEIELLGYDPKEFER